MMKKNIAVYLNTISENDYDTLEEIVIDKYQQFMDAYWYLREYSDYISRLQYKKTKKHNLKLEISIVKLPMNEVVEEIKKRIPEVSKKNDVELSYEGRVLYLTIKRKESKPIEKRGRSTK